MPGYRKMLSRGHGPGRVSRSNNVRQVSTHGGHRETARRQAAIPTSREILECEIPVPIALRRIAAPLQPLVHPVGDFPRVGIHRNPIEHLFRACSPQRPLHEGLDLWVGRRHGGLRSALAHREHAQGLVVVILPPFGCALSQGFRSCVTGRPDWGCGIPPRRPDPRAP